MLIWNEAEPAPVGTRAAAAGAGRKWHVIQLPFLLFLIALAGGCQDTYKPACWIPEHVISLDSDAVAHDPLHYEKKLGMEEGGDFDKYIQSMFCAMDRWHQTQEAAAKPGQPPVRKILIFIHGGLNTFEDATADAEKETPYVEGGGYYPIYINWDSGFISSYGEHMVAVSQGYKAYKKPEATGRALLSPFYLVADLGRAITRIPVVWSQEIGYDSQTVQSDLASVKDRPPGPPLHWLDYTPPDQTTINFRRLNALYADELSANPKVSPDDPHRHQVMVSIGLAYTTRKELEGLATAYTLTIPTKFGLSWALDGLGKSSWDNMTRRTLLIVDGSDQNPLSARRFQKRGANEQPGDSLAAETEGPALLLINKLAEHMHDAQDQAVRQGVAKPQYEITLVGHSMGAMVINELLSRIAFESEVEFKNIVYMAAAASVRDTARCVVPYLREHKSSEFFNLCLHPTADLQERDAGDVPPRGSLLVWIDNFFSDPPTMYDRTMGRWVNVLEAINEFPQDVRGRMTLKAFDLAEVADPCPKREPQMHGQFRDQPYWDPTFWQAERPYSPAK